MNGQEMISVEVSHTSLSGVGGCSHLVLHKKDTVLEENVKEERLCLCICVT